MIWLVGVGVVWRVCVCVRRETGRCARRVLWDAAAPPSLSIPPQPRKQQQNLSHTRSPVAQQQIWVMALRLSDGGDALAQLEALEEVFGAQAAAQAALAVLVLDEPPASGELFVALFFWGWEHAQGCLL